MSSSTFSIGLAPGLEDDYREWRERVAPGVSYRRLMEAIVLYTATSASIPTIIQNYDRGNGAVYDDTKVDTELLRLLNRRLRSNGIKNMSRAVRSVMARLIEDPTAEGAVLRFLPNR